MLFHNVISSSQTSKRERRRMDTVRANPARFRRADAGKKKKNDEKKQQFSPRNTAYRTRFSREKNREFTRYARGRTGDRVRPRRGHPVQRTRARVCARTTHDIITLRCGTARTRGERGGRRRRRRAR